MSLLYGFLMLVAVLAALPLAIYSLSISSNTRITTSGGRTPYVIAAIVVIAIWWLYGFGLWTVALIFMVAGLGLLLWGKTPDVWKTIGGIILAVGAIIAVVIYVFGADNVESKRMALQTTVAGKNAPPPVPLTATEQAARVLRAQQDAELHVINATKVAAANAAANFAAAEVERSASQLTYVKGTPCRVTNTKEMNCETVVFGFKHKYYRKALPQHCLNYDESRGLTIVPLGGNQYDFIANEGFVVQLYDVPNGLKDGHGKLCVAP